MNMRKPNSIIFQFTLLLPVFAVLFFSCGCASDKPDVPEKPEEEYATANVPDMKQQGEFIIRNFLDGDFEKYITYLPGSRRKKVSRETFTSLSEKFREKMGQAKWIDYLGELKQGNLTTYIWRVGFIQEKPEEGKKAERFDMLYRITVAKLNGQDSIVQLGWDIR